MVDRTVLEGERADDFFGQLEVGDFDGNGLDDLAVAAIRDDTAGEWAGAVYVLAGRLGVATDGAR